MREYEIYLPTTHNDRRPVDPREVEAIKATLTEVFGGYTHLNHRSEGVWRLGGVTFHDEVTIVRVLDDGSRPFDMAAFKQHIEERLQQENVLIVERTVHPI